MPFGCWRGARTSSSRGDLELDPLPVEPWVEWLADLMRGASIRTGAGRGGLWCRLNRRPPRAGRRNAEAQAALKCGARRRRAKVGSRWRTELEVVREFRAASGGGRESLRSSLLNYSPPPPGFVLKRPKKRLLNAMRSDGPRFLCPVRAVRPSRTHGREDRSSWMRPTSAADADLRGKWVPSGGGSPLGHSTSPRWGEKALLLAVCLRPGRSTPGTGVHPHAAPRSPSTGSVVIITILYHHLGQWPRPSRRRPPHLRPSPTLPPLVNLLLPIARLQPR